MVGPSIITKFIFVVVAAVVAIGPVRPTRNLVWFEKKSVNAKPFLVRTIFCTDQNFCKRYVTSKIPSTSFGGCKNKKLVTTKFSFFL